MYIDSSVRIFRFVSIDDKSGRRTIAPIENLHGITKFEVIRDPNPTSANAVSIDTYMSLKRKRKEVVRIIIVFLV